MRNTLQYLYTILVFTGALATSYLMVSQNELRNQTRTAQNIDSKETYRREAAFDTSVSKLFEMESALSQFPASSSRMPALDSADRTEKKPTRLRNAHGKKSAIGERSSDEMPSGAESTASADADFDLFK